MREWNIAFGWDALGSDKNKAALYQSQNESITKKVNRLNKILLKFLPTTSTIECRGESPSARGHFYVSRSRGTQPRYAWGRWAGPSCRRIERSRSARGRPGIRSVRWTIRGRTTTGPASRAICRPSSFRCCCPPTGPGIDRGTESRVCWNSTTGKWFFFKWVEDVQKNIMIIHIKKIGNMEFYYYLFIILLLVLLLWHNNWWE